MLAFLVLACKSYRHQQQQQQGKESKENLGQKLVLFFLLLKKDSLCFNVCGIFKTICKNAMHRSMPVVKKNNKKLDLTVTFII